MVEILTLDNEGVLIACVMGVMFIIFGVDQGFFFLAVIIWFLFLSAVVTELGKRRKKTIGVFEKTRGWKNVIANGTVPLFVAILYFFNQGSWVINSDILVVSYVASVAAITSDKFASEVGVLDGRPTMLMTMKKVKQGTSGAVTFLGILAGVLASVLVGAFLFNYARFEIYLVVIVLAGLFGNLTDSFLGYYEEKGIGNKYTSNLVCAFVGWFVSLVLLIIMA